MIVVWSLAAPEVISALARQRREERLGRSHFAAAKRRLASLEDGWHEITQWEAVRARARRLLEAHPLRAADGLHLAAALVVTEDRPSGCEFATFDERLAEAAEEEGFSVLSAKRP